MRAGAPSFSPGWAFTLPLSSLSPSLAVAVSPSFVGRSRASERARWGSKPAGLLPARRRRRRPSGRTCFEPSSNRPASTVFAPSVRPQCPSVRPSALARSFGLAYA